MEFPVRNISGGRLLVYALLAAGAVALGWLAWQIYLGARHGPEDDDAWWR